MVHGTEEDSHRPTSVARQLICFCDALIRRISKGNET